MKHNRRGFIKRCLAGTTALFILPRLAKAELEKAKPEHLTTIKLSDPSIFRENDLLLASTTQEILRVISVTGSTLAIERAWCGTKFSGKVVNQGELYHRRLAEVHEEE